MVKETVITTLLTGCFLTGCSAIDEKGDGDPDSYVGKTTKALFAAIGEPKYSIDTTFDDERASRTYVYATKDPSLGCVESYKVDSQSQRIIEYACR